MTYYFYPAECYVYLSDTNIIHENTYIKCKNYCMEEKGKKRHIKEHYSWSTESWHRWLSRPSLQLAVPMISKSLPYFQLSISDKLSDKESEQSISDILSLSTPCQSGSCHWSFLFCNSFSSVSRPALLATGLCQLTYGHRQVTDRTRPQWSHLFCSKGPQAVFCQQLLCPGASPQLLLSSIPPSATQTGSRAKLPLLRSCCAARWLTTLG